MVFQTAGSLDAEFSWCFKSFESSPRCVQTHATLGMTPGAETAWGRHSGGVQGTWELEASPGNPAVASSSLSASLKNA